MLRILKDAKDLGQNSEGASLASFKILSILIQVKTHKIFTE